MERIRFVFETIGTRGDVAPLLAIAREVQDRGHEAALLAPAAFAPDAATLNVPFVATSELHIDQSRELEFDDFYFPAFQAVVDYFERASRSNQPLVVVNGDKTATSNLLCERHGFPAVRLHLAPFKIRSTVSPPWPYAGRARGRCGRAYRRYALPRYLDACDRHAGLLAHINARRRALGLRPAQSATPDEPHLRQQVCLFPEWYCAPALDWPTKLKILGFPLPAPTTRLSERASSFLAAGAPPLVFTTGTGVHEVEDFFGQAKDCCVLLKRRGLFLSPHLRTMLNADPALLSLDHEEMGLVLPHSALLVHHGGIGTLARAIEAGIPQIVSPLKFDQPDNAHRVEELGLGARLERSELTGRSLAMLAERLLDDRWDRRRLTEARDLVRASRSIRDCASLLEGAVSPSFSPTLGSARSISATAADAAPRAPALH